MGGRTIIERIALRVRFALVAATVAAPGGAAAEGWNIRDLGHVESRDECMRKADEVINWYRDTYASSYVVQLSWTSFGYNLTPGENDAVIICTIDGNGRRAILAITGDREGDRALVADRIEQRWEQLD